MESLVRETSICPGGLIFLPYLLGERTPIWNPDCRGVFFGLNRSHRKQDMLRAIFEGVSFSIYSIIKVFNELNAPINSLTVAGGLSRMDSMNQIKSDMFDIEVKRYNNFETTAIGSAIIALTSVGKFTSLKDAFNTFCSIEKVYEPNTKNHAIYSEYFELYMNVYRDLERTFSQRAHLVNKLTHKENNKLVVTENL